MPTETITKKLFTVDEYHRLWEVGILPETGRFELIRGEIIEMPLPESPHSSRVNRLIRAFTSRLGESVIVSVQNPLFVDTFSEPLPDVALLKPKEDFYETAHPSPQDVILVVEVSHKSAGYDRNIKAPLYAEAGISEYWQLDVLKGALIVRRDPFLNEYRSVQVLQRGERVSLMHFPGVDFEVDELLGGSS